MTKNLSIVLGALIIVLIVMLVSLFMLFFNYRRNLAGGRDAIKKLSELEKQYADLTDKHTVLQTTYDDLYNQYLELEKYKDRLYNLAYVDELTGLNNRYFIKDRIEDIFSTLRKDEKFALMHIDVDDFKDITGVIGHSYGDELILDISHRLKEAVDDNDFICAYGSDEFLVLCQNIDNADEFDVKVKKIMKVLSYPFIVNSKEVSITVSIGIVIAPDYAKNQSEAIDYSTLAMYEAKQLGKNTFHYYSDQIVEKLSNDVLIQHQLSEAIANQEIIMYAQPVYENGSDRIISYEALARWNNPEEGLLLPEQFLEVAYSTGQIKDIDELMFNYVCQHQKNMDNKNMKDMMYSINMSLDYLSANGTVENIDETVKYYHADPSRIIIEINESQLDISKCKDLFDRINEIGIKICVDDFGKNNASINEINAMPIYMVKVDANLISDAVFDEGTRAMLSSIVDMCNNFKIKCVVKGVEFEEQIDYLKTLSCDGIQGFALCQPQLVSLK